MERRVRILLVEDNEDHAYLIQKALYRTLKERAELSVVSDGEEAIQYIKTLDGGRIERTPDLIFLDIKLPKKDGFEVLQELKQDPDCKHIPVIMLTSSSTEREIAQGYALGANSYISKPISASSLVKKVRRAALYWLQVSSLPSRKEEQYEGT